MPSVRRERASQQRTHDGTSIKLTIVVTGVAAVATSSGMAAQFLAVATICQKGDNIVSSANLYGTACSFRPPFASVIGVIGPIRDPCLAHTQAAPTMLGRWRCLA